MCYAVPVCGLWAFGRVVLKLAERWEARAAGSIPHHTPLLWKFSLTTVCPRLRFIEAINLSVFIPLLPLLSVAFSPSPLQGLAFNSFGPWIKCLSLRCKTFQWFWKLRWTLFTPSNIPVLYYIVWSPHLAPLPDFSTSGLISYLSPLLQYQIMYYARARHLPSPENHLFPTVMRLNSRHASD